MKILKDLKYPINEALLSRIELKQIAQEWINSLEHSHMHYAKKERMTCEERDFLIEWIEFFFDLK